MSSRLLYDTRDNSILRCQPEPSGSAELPSIEALYKSARIAKNDKQYMNSIIINENIITHEAQERLRIVELAGEIQAKEKPKLTIVPNTKELDTAVNNILTLTLEVTNTLSIDNITEVNMNINDVSFSISINNNTGSKDIELTEPDTYIISCSEDRFISQKVKVEVI